MLVWLSDTCAAPNFTPTNLAILHKNATGVTISWTAVNASDADGYIVNITLLSSAHTNNPTLVDVGNVTQYTLKTGTTFQLTVRAYQDLLGPASNSISNGIIIIILWLILLLKLYFTHFQWCLSPSTGHWCHIVLVQWSTKQYMLNLITLCGEWMAQL